jgi:probable HAF family extracellular repeat protein
VNTGIANSRTSSGNAINNNGQVVGLMSLTPPFPQEPPQQAFLYTPGGSVVDIDNVVDRQSNALSINNAGDVTGSLSTGACLITFASPSCLGNTHAFIYKGSGLVDIGTLGGTYSAGWSINDHDEIAGVSSVTGSSLNHLFLYAQGHMRDLGTVAGESFVNAEINDRGEIVGSAANSAGVGSSFIYRGHSFEKIPLIADSLNNKGEVAGTKTVANGSSQAFLYKEGKLTNLNDLVDPSLTLLTNANGISDNGKIVASGLNGHLYVLTPK